MRVENNNVSGQNHDPEQIDLIDLLVQLWRGKMTIIISVIVAIALAIGYLAVAKEKWTSTAIVTQPDVGTSKRKSSKKKIRCGGERLRAGRGVPGVSLGWRVSEEDFFKKLLPDMDNLKIRRSARGSTILA